TARVYELDFHGDTTASPTETMRHHITPRLPLPTDKDELVLRPESGGGILHSPALASPPLAPNRQAATPPTLSIDTVAASGGYM
ncbi:protease SohB, partial [Pseudomonas syringae pv. tagetis]